MRISTYNIWDSERGMPARFYQILAEIKSNNADILCVQELPDYEAFNAISELCGYDEGYWNDQYGVGIYTKFEATGIAKNDYGIAAVIDIHGVRLLVMNVHLPWKSALKREELIVEMIESAHIFECDYTVIAGDFNCSENSSVHRYLKGDQSLLGSDTYFVDLAEAFAEIEGSSPKATLDVRNNPRYRDEKGCSTNTIEINQRYDRILLKNPFPKAYPRLSSFGIFGTKVSPVTELCASDHYGVFADLEFEIDV